MSDVPRHKAAVWFAIALLMAVAQPLAGQSPQRPVYRRVFVPDDALDSQIHGLLPMKREEFQRRMVAARTPGPAPTGAIARVERAMFRAVLKGTRLEQGEAELSLVSSSGQPTLVSLEPCNLTWESVGDGATTPVVGMAADGNLCCLADRSGLLRLGWTKSGRETGPGAVRFDLRLPQAPRRLLEITAPAGVELSAVGNSITGKPSAAKDARWRVWPIELSGDDDIQLVARWRQQHEPQVARTIVREETTYSVLRSVVDLQTRFSVDLLDEPLSEINLQAPNGLQVIGVRIAGQSVPFSHEGSTAADAQLVKLELPAPLEGIDQLVEVDSTAEWTGDKTYKLPRLLFLGADFQAGSFVVQAPSWLRLQARPLGGCVQSGAASAAAGRTIDQFAFQAFSSSAAIEMTPNPTLLPLREESGMLVGIQPHQVTGVLVAELTAAGGGARFAIEADLPRQWIVDSVETQPADQLAERILLAPSQGPQRLQLKLAHPLTAQHPLRLILRGHYRRPPNGEALDDAFFQLATFPDVHDRRQLISVRVDDPEAELRINSEAVTRLDSSELPAADLRLFESPPASLLLERASLSQAIRGTLKPTTARYQADAIVRAEIRRGRIDQTIKVHCEPETSAVASVIVRLAPRPTSDVTWTIAGDSSSPLPILVEDGSSTTAAVEEAVYRLLLPRPYNSPLDLVGRFSESYSPGDAVCLAFLPAAVRQSGELQIYAPDGDVFVRPSEMQAVPPSPDDDRHDALCGRYRYEPGRRSKATLTALPSGVLHRRAWIENLELSSEFLTDGRAQHEAVVTIQNRGARQLNMHLADAVADCFLAIDGGEEQPLDVSHPTGSAVISLPDGPTAVVARVRYSTGKSTAALWPITRVRAVIPQFDAPVLTSSWRVLLPPGMSPAHQTPLNNTVDSIDRQNHPANFDEVRNTPTSPWKSLLTMVAGPALAIQALAPPESSTRGVGASLAGWTELRGDLPPDEEATMTVYQRPVIASWSMCLLFLTAALTQWFTRRDCWLAVVAALLASMSLFIGSPLAWLTAASSAGLLVGLLFSLIRRDVTSCAPSSAHLQPTLSSLRYASGTTGALLLLIVLFITAWSIRVTADEIGANAANDLPRVVFPIDAQGQPSGDYVYVEETLYDELHRLNPPQAEATWLLQKAKYALSSSTAAGIGSGALIDLAFDLDFQTLAPDQSVELPLRRHQLTLLAGRARLDGASARLAWSADGGRLLLNVAKAGQHHLKLALATVAAQADDANVLEIEVPRVAISTVKLQAAAGNATIVDSGSTGRLSVRWPSSGTDLSRGQSMAADRLLLWKIRPGSASLESRFRLRQLATPPREALFDVDPRLRLLPGRTGGQMAVVKPQEGQSKVKVDLSEFDSTTSDVRLSWLWTDATGIGRLTLPNVELTGHELQHDWTIVSLDPALELDPTTRAFVDQVANPSGPAAQIAKLWPDIDVAGALVFDSPVNSQLELTVKPAASTPRAVQRTDWSVSRSLAQATYTADVTGLAPTRFEHRLAIPPQVHVSRVNILQAQRPAALRWAQQRDGTLVVSLLEPPASEHTITIAADLALPGAGGAAALPAFSLADTVDERCQLRINRRSDVQLRLERATGWISDEESQTGDDRRSFGRLVAALKRQSPEAGAPRVVWSANEAQVRGSIFTRVDEADGDWLAEVQLRLNVSGGLLDELRLSVPESWGGPLAIEPAMEQHFEASASDARRQLILRPTAAMTGSVDITIRGPIHGGSGGLQAPDVMLVGDYSLDRYVMLNGGSAGHTIDWDVTGLLPISGSPAPEAPLNWRTAGGDTFRVIGQRFDATAKVRPNSAPSPRATLADLRVKVHLPGKAVVEALATIEPRGASTASFTLPRDARLIAVLLDDVPLACAAHGVRTWSVSVPGEAAAFRLTVLYEARINQSSNSGSMVLAAPTLIGIPVHHSVWSVAGAGLSLSGDDHAAEFAHAAEFTVASSRAGSSGPPAEPCSDAQAHLSRFHAVADALEATAAAVSANASPKVLRDSFVRWKRELASIDHQLTAIQAAGGLSVEEISQWRTDIEAAAKVQQRLVQAGVLEDSDTGQTATQANDDATSELHFTAEGTAADLILTIQQRIDRTSWPRGAIAAFLAIAGGVLAILFPVVQRLAPPLRASLVLAMLGLGWWITAPLGWLGWFGMLAAAFGAARWRLLHAPASVP